MQIQAITTPALVISFEGEEAAAFYVATKHAASVLTDSSDEKTLWAATILGNFANGISPAFTEDTAAQVIEHED